MTGADLARAAESLAGSPFRLHGRDPATGLDCIGLLVAAMGRLGRVTDFPSGYTLRTHAFAGLALLAERHGFEPAGRTLEPGDVFFVRSGPGQMHLMITGCRPDRLVEAHAGLRRVVIRPAPVSEPIIERWRLCPRHSG